MFVILGCIYYQHDLRLLAAAVVMCLLSCITARTMVLRGRASPDIRLRMAWLVGAGLATGVGVWATHFIAMLAYVTGLPTTFALDLTILSVVVAMMFSAAGFALSFSRAGGAFGGMVVGIAILAMHYIGMAAIRIPAQALWNENLVIASVLIGISMGGLAGHFAALRVTLLNNAITVTLRAAAIIGVHFTGMAAVRFVPTGVVSEGTLAVSPAATAMLVMATTAFIVGQALVLALVDAHLSNRAKREELRLRAYIGELEIAHTALEKTSADLTTALDAAQAAGKSKSAFLASMSHELRTPLNAVLGFSEMMQLETFGPLGSERYKGYLGSIHDSGAHLLALINDILDISRLDTGNGQLAEERFDPADTIADTMRMMSAQAAKAQVALVPDIAPDLPCFQGDRRRMRQILLNLLSNALKFTPAGGTVTLRARHAEDGLVIQVIDTGIGIAPQDFSKALEPFGQVDSSLARKYEGTGLGLPLTRQLAELHGGSLTLDSVVGQGTTVTVTLPAWRLGDGKREPAAAA